MGKRPSGLTETIGVNDKTITFNDLICKKMGITRESKIVVLVNDDGYLAFNVLGKDSPTGKRLCHLGRGKSLGLNSTALRGHFTRGRYHLTGRDGAFWLTDIKYSE